MIAGCQLLVPGTLDDVKCMEEGAIGPPVCPLGTFCHDGVCRDGPPSLGEPCGDDVVCGPGDECLEPEKIGLHGDPFCSRTCCSSADCGVGSGLVCGVLGPGKVCVPHELWDRDRPGSGFAGEPCDRGSDCRSGECAKDAHTCVDACCSDAECATFGAVCRDTGAGWTCAAELVAPKAFLQLCEHDAECSTGVCAPWADGKGRCVDPCCSSTECGKVKLGDVVKSVLCVPVPHGAAIVYACAAVSEGEADRAVGEPCDDAGQCRGGACIETLAEDLNRTTGTGGSAVTKVCSDVCCTDASCGAPHLFACVPIGDPPLAAGAPGTGGQGFDLQCRRR